MNTYDIARLLYKQRPEKIDATRQYWSLLCIHMADLFKKELTLTYFDKDLFLDICHGLKP